MKKRMTVILTIILLSNYSFSQTLDKLDEKRGFKEFAIGDSYDKWKSQVKEIGLWKDGGTGYEYIGNCCDEIFDYPVGKILLRFNNKILEAIIITTGNFQKPFSETGEYTKWRPDDFGRIKSLFSQLFGQPTSMKDDGGNVTFYWQGKEVVLISKYEYLGVKSGDRQQITIGKANNILKEF